MIIQDVIVYYFDGVDLMSIESMSHATVLSIISEISHGGFYKFETAKHFK